MATFVLVHGAWRGSWTWKRLRPLLLDAGHQVMTPSLTGLADRNHLLTRDVGLEMHIADVSNLIVWEDLTDIVLLGHSYGGVVVRHVADRLPQRIRSLVYMDAFVPENGRSLMSYLPDGGEPLRLLAASVGDGWKVPVIPAAEFGDKASDCAWIDAQSTMHPISTFETATSLWGDCDRVADITYIYASQCPGPFWQFYDMAVERGWRTETFACGHDIMTEMPDELAALMLHRFG